MSFRSIFGAAVAALLLCGVSLAAPTAGGAGGEMPLNAAGAGSDAAGLEELRVGAAELAAVPAESRALFAKVLGWLEGMRGELEELKAGKARSDDRAESLTARVAKLEENGCGDVREEESSTYHHRMQDADDGSDTAATPTACHGANDIAMIALNASLALSQSHARLQVLLTDTRTVEQQLAERLATKANTSTVDAQLLRKADVDEMVAMSSRLDGKINLTTVAKLMVAKANASTVDALSNALADATTALADKAEESSVVVRLAGKAGIEAVEASFAGKADESSVATRLAEKADAFALGILQTTLSEKANLTVVNNITGLVQSLASDLAATRAEMSRLCVRRAEYTCLGGNLTNLTGCLPACNTEHHGHELLATIDGTDTKFSCNLAHGLYSWMGAASEGGYLGPDVQSFFSAVVSGAAGNYIVTLTADASIRTDLTIRPGQDVRISGDPSLAAKPRWGSGGFNMQEATALSLSSVQIDTTIRMEPGVLRFNLHACTLTFTETIELTAASVTFTDQVFAASVAIGVPSGAIVHIVDSSCTFSETVDVGLMIEGGANLTVSDTLLTMTQASLCKTDTISVDDGGRLSVEDSNMALCNGTNVPFPCNGITSPVEQLSCVEPHSGLLILDGPVTVDTSSGPLVCPMDGIGSCVTPSPFQGYSEVMRGGHRAQLKQWLGGTISGATPQSYELCYRLSRDGGAKITFHNNCDSYSSSLTVARLSSGYIVGGFSPVSYDISVPATPSDGDWYAGDDSWIFHFTDARIAADPWRSTGSHRLDGGRNHGVSRHPSYGPYFGNIDLHFGGVPARDIGHNIQCVCRSGAESPADPAFDLPAGYQLGTYRCPTTEATWLCGVHDCARCQRFGECLNSAGLDCLSSDLIFTQELEVWGAIDVTGGRRRMAGELDGSAVNLSDEETAEQETAGGASAR